MSSTADHSAPRLGDLLAPFVALDDAVDREISAVSVDSRQVEPGAVFFARRGLTHDAGGFVGDAVRAGAVATVREGDTRVSIGDRGVVEIFVPDLAACAGEAAHRFYGRPSESMRVIGVTGTNGKTSVSHFVAHGLSRGRSSDSAPAGLIGTLGYGLPGRLDAGMLTTPDVVHLHRLLSELRAKGADHVVMEVSSHALSQKRVEGVRFDTAVFTNLSRDHLDFHGDMETYGAAKARLFMSRELRSAVVNVDDAFGIEILNAVPPGIRVAAYSMDSAHMPVLARNPQCVLRGKLERVDADGIRLAIQSDRGEGELSAPLLGRFNAHNLLAALGVLLEQGVAFERALASLSDLPSVPGRMQRFGSGPGQPLIVVDYAHTPGALDAALRALREHCGGRLWCVFGCGGDRDEGKRAQMGAVAESLADVIVLTDDNPRNEDGESIVHGILEGLNQAKENKERVFVQRDRAVAIQFAVLSAETDDIVLVAGKGHETYQEVLGVRRPFSDAAAVRAALEAKAS
ncbi:MAG TPA: UDP-N-acetylmuramoyl-L-alanyl-D-glutamate--2,6-diaminopimelate ligase [Gammaproteobacteria bacterium]|nr:UDP-N-acetylmuramoyl-L-alanyl-D-glutamate--2,6-diaminopimelate ligase [Gammaproteobacteria bacterium]